MCIKFHIYFILFIFTSLNQVFSLTLPRIVTNTIASNSMQPAIINGASTEKNEYPFMVALGTLELEIIKWQCGGSIISQKLIITAAHCKGVTNIMVGTNNLIDVKPNQTIGKNEFTFTEHALYVGLVNANPGPNDIAVIKLKTDLQFNEHVNSITLTSENYGDGAWPNVATAIGFGSKQIYGSTSTKILTQVQLYNEPCTTYKTVSNQICYGDKNQKNKSKKKGTCRGDSGGPLFIKNVVDGSYVQIGMVSYAFAACALAPTVFTSIPLYREWINEQSQNTTTS